VGRGYRLLHYSEGIGGTVTVAEHRTSGEKLCYVDNSFVCGTSYNALKTVRMLAHLPILTCDSPERVLVVGFGMGVTSHSVSLHPDVKEIHIAELTKGVVEASDHFSDYNGGVLDDPRVTLKVEDGRNYLLLSDEKFDCITCDPTHPVLGSGALYTKEYFTLCREKLNPGGTVAQYLPLHMLSFRDFKSIARTFNEVFPNSCLWLTFSHCILLGRAGPMELDFSSLEHRMLHPAVNADLGRSDLDTPVQFLSCFMLCAEEIRNMARTAPLNEDYFPVVEFSGGRSLRETWAANLDSLSRRRQSPKVVVRDAPPHIRQSIDTYSLARGESLRGRVCQYEGRYGDALEHYKRALSHVNDDDETLMLAAHTYKRMKANAYAR
jgi:spermidine synthase